MEGYHKPVLLKETIKALDVREGNWYLDCTLGDGGHSLIILQRGGKVLGIDVDPKAIERTKERLEVLGYRQEDFKLIHGNFRDIDNLIKQTELKNQKFAGAIFDLGVSSLQLEDPARGFSFSKKGPLDMRMDPNLSVRALDLINILSRKELYELFKRLGEEKYSRSLARALVSAREVRKGIGNRVQGTVIETTKDLAEIVERTVGRKRGEIHPATRVFQALRIVVNDELGALKEGLEQIKEKIEKNGHILVISFHSLEDRIVKDAFRKWQDSGFGEIVNKKPIVPGSVEVEENPRSRSAKMRVFKIT